MRGPLSANSGPYLTDRFGRVVFLHGVNAVYKRPPFELSVAPGKPWDFSRADAAQMARLGFNVVRLGIIWQGIEPGTLGPNNPAVCTPGPPQNPHQFNQAVAKAYLAKVARTVDLLGRYHIYTLLDMHEDVYSSLFGGEGAPPWAVCTNGLPIRRLPGRWSNTYNDPALRAAVSHFWTNDVQGNLEGQFLRVWKTVAEYFRYNPWVVGYDPLNEPFTTDLVPGDPMVASQLECLYTGSAHPGLEHIYGTPLTCPPQVPRAGLIPTLRHLDPHRLIFYEPDIFSSRGGPSDIGPMNYSGLVFNFHVYCPFRNGVTGNPTDVALCARKASENILRRSEERPANFTLRQPRGPGWFMSEFGATNNEALVAQVTAAADRFQLGWTYWSWKYYQDPTGSSDEALVTPSGALSPTATALGRTYPQAVAGTPLSFSFDPTSGAFALRYLPNPHIAAPTVIAVPVALHYPAGYCPVAAGGRVISAPDANRLLVANDRGARSVAVLVTAGSCSS